MDQAHYAEQPWPGGSVSTGVVRVGDTVRRPAGPHTPGRTRDHRPLRPGLLESGDRPAVGVHRLGSGGAGNAAVGCGLCRARVRPAVGRSRWRRRDAGSRVRVFADAYGLDETQRRELVPMLARRTCSMCDFLAREAWAGIQRWAGIWDNGHGDAQQASSRGPGRQPPPLTGRPSA